MKKGKAMLEYSKMILKAVSFDQRLFRKEYRKALMWLSNAEASELKYWVRGEFIQSDFRTLKQAG